MDYAGWSRKFSLTEMQEAFDIDRVSLGGPVFDVAKLDWLNGKYIRENLTAEAFAEAFRDWAFSPEKIQGIVPLVKDRVERLSDVVPLAGFFLSGLLPVSEADFAHKQLNAEQCKKSCNSACGSLNNLVSGQGTLWNLFVSACLGFWV